ncbi:MAG TPA: hypothetical protein VK986_06515 [Tepidisphaeraceae bacterium]|nr:hypothetical protein [Tepidisphaeraceae bacterium]
MDVRGIEHLTVAELIDEVRHGGRFVVFRASVGLLVATVELASPVYFVREGERPAGGGRWWRNVLTSVMGWWAIPGGPGRAIACLRDNARGGLDVTVAVLRHLAMAEARGLGLNDFPQMPPMARPHAA